MLREGERLNVYCTRSVRDDLTTGNPLFPMLESYCGVSWREAPNEAAAVFAIPAIQGIEFMAVPVQSKVPPYSSHRDAPQKGDNIALMITDTTTGKRCFYAPGLAAVEPAVWECMTRADCVLVDGTFWTDDEMIRMGVGRKRGLEMGHLAQSGADGMISWLRRLPQTRRVLIHINNTNPILNEDSSERMELDSLGIEVAFDGMEIAL
jgi:pyrroloquinoline quinone biosynthesis protein B